MKVCANSPHCNLSISMRVLATIAFAVASWPVEAQVPASLDTGVAARIREAVESIRMVDTHEHLPSEEELREGAPRADFGSLFEAYQIQDLISAGMPRTLASRIGDPDVPVAEKWRLMAEYWPEIKTTGYGQTVSIAARDLYGIDTIDESTVQELSRRVREMRAGPLFEEVLRKRARIDISLVYRPFDPRPQTPQERRYVRRLFGYDKFCDVYNFTNIEEVASSYHASVATLADYEHLMAQEFERDMANGMVGVKSFYAYRRTLDYDDVPRAEANRIFELMKARGAKPVSAAQAKAFQDYMFFQILRLCEVHQKTIQLHTGYQSGNGNFIANANPIGLTKAFFRFPTVKFCLLHSSYPYAGELAALAKAFPNVYIDMAWAPMISPAFSEQALENFLGAVPNDKIMVFGGDNQIPEGTYGASVLARQVVARVLINRVQVGELTEEEARELAVKLLRTNAIAAYQLRDLGYRDPVAADGPEGQANLAMRTHEGVISHWRVLGSFPLAASPTENIITDLRNGQFTHHYKTEQGFASWTDARAGGAGTLLLNDSLDTKSEGVSYALASLHSKARGRATLLFGANAATEIFLNGRSVRSLPTSFFSDQLTEIPLDLESGENQLLVKIVAARGHGPTMKYWDVQIQGQVIAPDGLLDR